MNVGHRSAVRSTWWVYAHRVTGGHRDHRYSCCALAARPFSKHAKRPDGRSAATISSRLDWLSIIFVDQRGHLPPGAVWESSGPTRGSIFHPIVADAGAVQFVRPLRLGKATIPMIKYFQEQPIS